jgi:hypothetical protein
VRQRDCTEPASRQSGSAGEEVEKEGCSARDKDLTQALRARRSPPRPPPAQRIGVLGPAEAPIAVICGRHR